MGQKKPLSQNFWGRKIAHDTCLTPMWEDRFTPLRRLQSRARRGTPHPAFLSSSAIRPAPFARCNGPQGRMRRGRTEAMSPYAGPFGDLVCLRRADAATGHD